MVVELFLNYCSLLVTFQLQSCLVFFSPLCSVLQFTSAVIAQDMLALKRAAFFHKTLQFEEVPNLGESGEHSDFSKFGSLDFSQCYSSV